MELLPIQGKFLANKVIALIDLERTAESLEYFILTCGYEGVAAVIRRAVVTLKEEAC